MMGECQKLRSAGELALAFRKSPETIRHALAHVEPDGTIERFGNKCSGWYFTALPQSWREELARAALKRRLTIEELIDFASKPWKPAVPLADCLPADIEKAKRLRASWAGTIDRMRSPALLPGELVRLGVRDYQKEFGFKITDKHWNFLHDRLLIRDGGAEKFERLELYLDDNARCAKPQLKDTDATPAWLTEIGKVIDGFEDFRQPKPTEEITLWLRALDGLKARTGSGATAAVCKRELTEFLFARIPALSKTVEALRKQIDRKWSAWEKTDGALSAIDDQRRTESGKWNSHLDLTVPEFNVILAYAVNHCGGRISQAWRELKKKKALPARILEHYSATTRKSWVPKRIRNAIKSAVKEGVTDSHGKRFAILQSPSIPGDYSDSFSQDIYQADDATLNHWVWFNDPVTGSIEVSRLQFLLMICARSMRILNFCFLYSKSYNSFSIRALMKRACLEHGIPRWGWGFEMGIWKNSKLVKGNQNIREISYDEAVDLGFRKFGMKFRHSLLPRAKVIEPVMGMLQNRMQFLPGCVGRNSRVDRYEDVEKQILDVQSGRVHPSKYFLHADSLVSVVKDICVDFNSEPIEGEKILRGLSPEQGFLAFAKPNDPVIKFHPAMGCLLDPYVPVTVSRRHGVTLKYGKTSYTYLNEEFGKMIGQRAFAHFDPDDMSQIALMDLDKRNITIVPRLAPISRYNATSEDIKRSRSQINEFLRPVTMRHVVIEQAQKEEHRQIRLDAATRDHVIEVTEKLGSARQASEEKRRRHSEIEINADKAGVIITPSVKERASAADALARVAEAKRAWLESKEDK